MILEAGVIIAIIIIVPLVSLLVWTFLIFPNIDGIAQDLSWYRYDNQSQHYLYWSGFWILLIVGGIGGATISTRK